MVHIRPYLKGTVPMTAFFKNAANTANLICQLMLFIFLADLNSGSTLCTSELCKLPCKLNNICGAGSTVNSRLIYRGGARPG